MKTNKAFLFFSSLLLMALTTEVASAYILPASALLKQYLRNRQKLALRNISLDLELSFFEDSPEAQSLEGRFYFADGGNMRLSATEDGGAISLLVEQKRVRKTNAQTGIFSRFPKEDLLASLFFPGGDKPEVSMNVLATSLKRLAINIDKQSYHRYDGKVVQMIGGKPTDKTASQLWVFKETGIPAYYRFSADGFDGQKHSYEVFLRGYGEEAVGSWFPAEVTYRCDGKHLVTISVQKAFKNNNLPDTLFSTLQGN